MNSKNAIKKRIIAMLNREEMEFLERLAIDANFSTGYHLSRMDAISALVDAAIKLHVSADGVKNREELINKILQSAAMYAAMDEKLKEKNK